MSDGCAIDARTRQHLGETYRELHEGKPVDRWVCESVRAPARPMVMLGWMSEIEYDKPTPEGEPTYWHPFEEHAQPELWIDARGKLFVRGRHYKTTTRGIEDMSAASATRVSHLDQPNQMVDLGRLRWIKYRNGHGSSRILRFTGDARPTVAHDEAGKLHFLRGQYRVDAKQELSKMARRRKYSRRAVRANPSNFQARVKTVGKMAALIGGSFVLSGIAINWAMSKVAPTATATMRGIGKIAAGVLVPVLAAGKVPADLLSGFAIAGVVGGGTDLYAAYRASRPAAGGFGLLGAGNVQRVAFPAATRRVANYR